MSPAEGSLAAARTPGGAGLRGRPERRRRLSFLALAAGLLCAAGVPLVAAAPAKAGTIGDLQAKAAALASEIDAYYAKLSLLDESYDQAKTRVSELEQSISADDRAIGAARRQLASDTLHLRAVAIDAYVNGASSGISLLFGGDQQQLPMQQAYLSAATADVNEAVSEVQLDRHSLTVRRVALQRSEASAAASLRQVARDLSEAKAVTASLENTLAEVKGQLAQAVAAQEQAQAAAAAAAAAKAAAEQPPPPPPVTNPGPPAGDGSGEVAVQAAESQLGVPYVWGGATPGVGFDCSGLTMWAWAQAGVQLAHGATDQYYEIAHVSMSDLQPGDLIFYGDAGYLYHVVMYVGSGPYGSDTVIQAEETGTDVMYTPIPPGAYGAGQP